jgi:hypothetical protein
MWVYGLFVVLSLVLVEVFYWKSDQNHPLPTDNELSFALERKMIAVFPATMLSTIWIVLGLLGYAFLYATKEVINYLTVIPPETITVFIMAIGGIIVVGIAFVIYIFMNALKFRIKKR